MVEMFMIIDNFYRLIISLLGECQYECCPFGGRCALQGDAASRKAHDLAGDGKPDTAATLFSGKEWNENVFGLLLRDNRPVIADLDQDSFFFVAVGFYLDQTICLSATDCLHGVFQQIQDDLRDQILVCIDDQVGRLYTDVDRNVGKISMMSSQLYHAFRKFLDIK